MKYIFAMVFGRDKVLVAFSTISCISLIGKLGKIRQWVFIVILSFELLIMWLKMFF